MAKIPCSQCRGPGFDPYQGINLPKEAKTCTPKNYKMLMKEIKDDTNRWRGIPHSWIRIINIVVLFFSKNNLLVSLIFSMGF